MITNSLSKQRLLKLLNNFESELIERTVSTPLGEVFKIKKAAPARPSLQNKKLLGEVLCVSRCGG